MFRQAATIAAVMAVASCGGSAGDDGTNLVTIGNSSDDTPTTPDPTPPSTGVPDELALNVNSVTYDTGTSPLAFDDTIQVQITSLDAPTINAAYTRNAALDVPGFVAFSAQDDPLDRLFVALAAQSADGSVTVAAVGDGGQFGEFYSGAFYERTGDANLPTTGLVSYAGQYAGVTNLDDLDQDQLAPIPPGTDPSLIPAQPRLTQGTVFLNVDFADGAVNGVIYDRQFTDGEALTNVQLTGSTIDANGEFIGTAEMFTSDASIVAGQYGGIFGTNGESVGGIVQLDTIFIPEDVRDNPFDREIGVFLLPACGTPTSPAVCNDVNPL